MKHFEAIKEFVRHADCGLYLSSLSQGYMSARIFLTSLELGVFSELGTRQLQAAELAKELDTDERATEALLNALSGMGLLKKENDLFSSIKEVSKYLDSESPDYKGDAFLHVTRQWDVWSRLTDIIRSGEPDIKRWTNEQSLGLAKTMKQEARIKADKIAAAMECTEPARMLDIGGGPGSYSIAFAVRYPNLRVDLFERDSESLRIAEVEIRRHNLQDRINIIKGDFLVDNFGKGYDIILLSSIMCLLGKKQNITILRKAKEALTKGGRVLVLDLEINESRTKPAAAAIFAVHMIVNTPHGRLYSASEVREFLHDIGYRNIVQVPVENSLFIAAEK